MTRFPSAASFLAVLLMPILLAAPLVRSTIAVNFALNQDEIASTQCEQRNIPGSCCAGSCVLNNSLQTVSGAESPMVPEEKNEAIEVLTLAPFVIERERKSASQGASIGWVRLLERWVDGLLSHIFGHGQFISLYQAIPSTAARHTDGAMR